MLPQMSPMPWTLISALVVLFILSINVTNKSMKMMVPVSNKMIMNKNKKLNW